MQVPPQQSARQVYQNPDLWLLDATGAKADAVCKVVSRGAGGARKAARSAGRLPPPPGCLSAAAQQRSDTLHHRYKPLFHPLADPALRVHLPAGPAAAGSRWGVAVACAGEGLVEARIGGPSAALQRLHRVQRRRLQQEPGMRA